MEALLETSEPEPEVVQWEEQSLLVGEPLTMGQMAKKIVALLLQAHKEDH
jgi:hypothetical protein